MVVWKNTVNDVIMPQHKFLDSIINTSIDTDLTTQLPESFLLLTLEI